MRIYSIILDQNRRSASTDNPHIESFNGSFRDELLIMNWLPFLEDARDKIERWRMDHNEFRPHSAIFIFSPAEFTWESGSDDV